MSLRTEIQSAFDEVAPPIFGLPERVVQTVLAEGPNRRRRERLMFRLRVPLALVAVFVAIALVVGVLIGGRLMQDWNSFRNSAPAGIGHADLPTLEARPLQLPHLTSNDNCPDGPATGGVYGNGPFYGDPALGRPSPRQTAWGIYWDLVGETDHDVSGLVLVRARDLKTSQPYVFVGTYAAGPVVGSDDLSGQTVQQHAELVLDTAHQPHSTSKGRTLWPFTVGVPAGNSGCYGWQIEGDTFTETFVFNVSPA